MASLCGSRLAPTSAGLPIRHRVVPRANARRDRCAYRMQPVIVAEGHGSTSRVGKGSGVGLAAQPSPPVESALPPRALLTRTAGGHARAANIGAACVVVLAWPSATWWRIGKGTRENRRKRGSHVPSSTRMSPATSRLGQSGDEGVLLARIGEADPGHDLVLTPGSPLDRKAGRAGR